MSVIFRTKRLFWTGCQLKVCVLVSTLLVGCGQQSAGPVASSDISGSAVSESAGASGSGANGSPASAPEEASVAAATDVVSQFLDLVRRGGGDSAASLLLTQKAQAELDRIGRTIEPIGSPDARFVVTRSEAVPDKPGAALVHSVWSEPSDSQSSQFQVVWALQNESGQWRISGLAIELDPQQSPLVINFEDGNGMAALLADVEPETDPGTAVNAANPSDRGRVGQATATGSTLSR